MATRKKTTKKAAKAVRKTAPKAATKKSVAVASSSAESQIKTRQIVERDLPVGTVLKRQFKGRQIEVTVVEGGFEYEDQTFKSISAVARRITGYQISGPVFFKLDGSEGSDQDGA